MYESISTARAAIVPSPWHDVSWEQWDDWHWQISNRITSVEELSQVRTATLAEEFRRLEDHVADLSRVPQATAGEAR